MEDHAVENEDIDISIIGAQIDKQKQINFSVNELLTNPVNDQLQQQLQANLVECPVQELPPVQGSFLRDLDKIQQSLSYQTNPFDIYQPQSQFCQLTKLVQAKQQDTCTRTLNNLNNLTKFCQKYAEDDCKHLIFDFYQEKQCTLKFKIKQNQDYYQSQILQSKRSTYKEDKQILSKSKSSTQLISSGFLSVNHHQQQQKNNVGVSPIKKIGNNKSLNNFSNKITKSKSHIKKLSNHNINTNSKTQRQSYNSRSSKSHSTSQQKEKPKKKQPNINHKCIKNQNTQAFMQYYGSSEQFKNQLKKNASKHKSKSKSKSKNKYKNQNNNKKIVFSKKIVHSHH